MNAKKVIWEEKNPIKPQKKASKDEQNLKMRGETSKKRHLRK